MSITDLIQNFTQGSEVDLRLQTEDAGDDRWDLYISVVSGDTKEKYAIERSVAKKLITESLITSTRYRELLELGDMLEPTDNDFTGFNPEEQFKILMEYAGMESNEHRPRTNIILHAYRELAKAIDTLSENGYDVTVAGSPEKAMKIASTYDSSA